MPRKDPFTQTCRQLAALSRQSAEKVDLHLHTTHSDGQHSPSDVVSLALRSGLAAIAVTDHDILSAIEPTRRTAEGTGLEVFTGVEISTEYAGKEHHLLAYFFDEDDDDLNELLQEIRQARIDRFRAMIERLQSLGIQWQLETSAHEWRIHSDRKTTILSNIGANISLGRPQLAQLLVEHGKVATAREAFHRYLSDQGRGSVSKKLVSMDRAIEVVKQAGGVTSWAHPFASATFEHVRQLSSLGLQAIEVEHPSVRPARSRQLRQWASSLGMGITGGSDSHGTDYRRAIGTRGISLSELEQLRELTMK